MSNKERNQKKVNLLAADLAGARVDINEASKALAYLRRVENGDDFFAYLRAVVRDGRAVIRSNQTLEYYRNLQAACERHLRGLPADAMAWELGWAIRLLRYYRAFPNAEIAHAPLRPSSTTEARTAAPSQPGPAETPQSATPHLLVVGADFLGKVLEADESAVLVEVPGFAEDKAIGVIKADDLGGKRFAKGNMARVKVVGVRALKSGRTIVELRPSVKKDEK
jgi:hypothetical protein